MRNRESKYGTSDRKEQGRLRTQAHRERKKIETENRTRFAMTFLGARPTVVFSRERWDAHCDKIAALNQKSFDAFRCRVEEKRFVDRVYKIIRDFQNGIPPADFDFPKAWIKSFWIHDLYDPKHADTDRDMGFDTRPDITRLASLFLDYALDVLDFVKANPDEALLDFGWFEVSMALAIDKTRTEFAALRPDIESLSGVTYEDANLWDYDLCPA